MRSSWRWSRPACATIPPPRLEDGERIARRARRADDRQRREDIDEDISLALDQPLEGHPLVQVLAGGEASLIRPLVDAYPNISA
jgi:hypothetical protein